MLSDGLVKPRCNGPDKDSRPSYLLAEEPSNDGSKRKINSRQSGRFWSGRSIPSAANSGAETVSNLHLDQFFGLLVQSTVTASCLRECREGLHGVGDVLAQFSQIAGDTIGDIDVIFS
jgi:hypothetical protein